jgi:hypothetical protein
MKLYLPQPHAGGLQLIHQRQQLPLPTDQLGAGLTNSPIVAGHRLERVDLFWRRRDVPRAAFSTVREDRALVQFASRAAAVRLAALSPQRVQRTWQQRLPPETGFEQSWELLLGLNELSTERAERLVHGRDPRLSV